MHLVIPMHKKLITAALAAVISVSASSVFTNIAFAQVEVVESAPTIRGLGQQRGNTTAPSTSPTNPFAPPATPVINMQAEFFNEMQLLQEEVRTLRGLVEELSYEVQRLKQQRTDDYLDLDRRLSELSTSGGAAPSSGAAQSAGSPLRSGGLQAPPVITSNATSGAASTSSADEMTAYRNAMDFLLQKKDYDRAIAALNDYLQKWPMGSYAPNSHYWLGEIYLLKSDLNEAQRWFTQLVEKFPQDRKANDAKFKLGRVLFQKGDKDSAKTLFQEVANSDGDAAPLARNFLQENYP